MGARGLANEQQSGNGPGRMHRMEGLMALLIDDHVKFQEEHKQLLTAQVVLTGRLAGSPAPQRFDRYRRWYCPQASAAIVALELAAHYPR